MSRSRATRASVILAAVAAVGLGYSRVSEAQGQTKQGTAAPAGPAPTEQTPAPKGKGRVLYYRNPMGLPDRSEVPKKDPMGMGYVPVYEDEASDAGIVTVSPGRLQTLGVRTASVEERPSLARAIRATGTVEFDERHLAVVTTKVEGWIEKLEVAATGEPVRRGQTLAWLYAPDIVASEQEYLVAAGLPAATHGGTAHGDPRSLLEAAVQRLRALDVPEEEITRLRRTGQAARRIAVRAPADGVVIEKQAVEGIRAGAGEPLYRTAGLSTVWLIAEVQERDLDSIRAGAKATATFVAFPGRNFEGTVDFVYPVLIRETRTARVRIVVPNPELSLRAGMYASVSIDTPAGIGGAPLVVVPDSAVIDGGVKQVVLVERGEGRFEPRAVHLGGHGDGYAQILDGVKPGERVVVGANFLIDAESNLRGALQTFAAPGPAGTSSQGDAK